MLVSFEPEFVFLEVPRTASRSMGRALKSISKRFTQYAHHRMEIPTEFVPFPTMACVRNPYAREYSHYLYRKNNRYNNMYNTVNGGKWSFTRYILWSTNPEAEPVAPHDKAQTKLFGDNRIDHLLRFEDLPGSFESLPFVPEGFELPRINRSPGMSSTNWRQVYTEELASAVYNWAGEDFERYGYGRESWRQDV